MQEPLSSLAAEYQSGSPILLEKIKLLTEEFAAIRRTRGDGNCFFRSFMFSYLERILESQDQEEVHRITGNVENCRRTLQSLGYADFTFEDFFALFLEQLESVLQGNKESISHDELIQRSRDQSVSDYIVMFFRFVTSGEIRKRSEFFEPFILGLTNATVEQFCKSSVEPMGEESDHVHITALSDALGVPIRVVYLDRSSCDAGGVSWWSSGDSGVVVVELVAVEGGGGGNVGGVVELVVVMWCKSGDSGVVVVELVAVEGGRGGSVGGVVELVVVMWWRVVVGVVAVLMVELELLVLEWWRWRVVVGAVAVLMVEVVELEWWWWRWQWCSGGGVVVIVVVVVVVVVEWWRWNWWWWNDVGGGSGGGGGVVELEWWWCGGGMVEMWWRSGGGGVV
ncbi:hypothetical protein RHMOL_Rhmol09G0182100 [Rhododendron molle]|uniref:Uncharacterized protein n=1 Tax=Rhododendron molle TaxID=49168 RepID=A0ACC0MEP1_RHOML|nr:hypothetical protein RHMOL_Rhmol09G0182100 [Rhododendron molle]